MKSGVFYVGFGGVDQIGRSCHYVGTNRAGVLLDAGLNPKGKEDKDIFPEVPRDLAKKVQAIIITHAHLDHIGGIIPVWRAVGKPPIYTSFVTRELVDTVLGDAANVYRRRHGDLPYTNQDVDELLRSIRGLPMLPTPLELDKGIKVTLFPAGHVPGAVYAYLEIEGKRIIYTGDFSLTKQMVVGNAYLPVKPSEVDMLITETTYGNLELPSRKGEVRELLAAVGEVLARGGRVLIPAFALGRAQEIILILQAAMAGTQLPRVNIYVDGLVVRICNKLNTIKGITGRMAGVMEQIDPSSENIFWKMGVIPVVDDVQRERIIQSSDPAIIIASSGMLTAGMSKIYAAKLLKDEPNSAIFLVGYQDEESPGHRLTSDGVLEINGHTIRPACEVRTYKLSAHTDRRGLLQFARVWNPKALVLVHGSWDARRSFASLYQSTTKGGALLPRAGDIVPVRQVVGTFVASVPREEKGEAKGFSEGAGVVVEASPQDGYVRLALNLNPSQVERLPIDRPGAVMVTEDDRYVVLQVKLPKTGEMYGKADKLVEALEKDSREVVLPSLEGIWEKKESSVPDVAEGVETRGEEVRKAEAVKEEEQEVKNKEPEEEVESGRQEKEPEPEGKVAEEPKKRKRVRRASKRVKAKEQAKVVSLEGEELPSSASEASQILRRILEPQGKAAEYREKIARIFELKQQKKTLADIGKEVGMARQRVWEKVKAGREKGWTDPEKIRKMSLVELNEVFPSKNDLIDDIKRAVDEALEAGLKNLQIKRTKGGRLEIVGDYPELSVASSG